MVKSGDVERDVRDDEGSQTTLSCKCVYKVLQQNN